MFTKKTLFVLVLLTTIAFIGLLSLNFNNSQVMINFFDKFLQTTEDSGSYFYDDEQNLTASLNSSRELIIVPPKYNKSRLVQPFRQFNESLRLVLENSQHLPRSLNLTEARLLLTMIEWFASLMAQHGIEFFLNGGSLVGTLRHQGIVPWDDDMDIVLDLDKKQLFLTAVAKSLRERPELNYATKFVSYGSKETELYKVNH